MQPDIPARRRKCEGREWGTPCPAHDDGTWPEGCDCYMKLNKDQDDSGLVAALAVLALAAIGIVIMTWVALGSARAADNDPPCLTKEQARAKWPKDYLYWHGANHCWDNVRAYATPNRSRKGTKLRPAPIDTHGNPTATKVKVRRWDEYNEIDAASDRDTFFSEQPLPVWKLWKDRIGL